MPAEVRESLLSVDSKGLELYRIFRKEIFTDRTKKLFDTQSTETMSKRSSQSSLLSHQWHLVKGRQ